MMRSRKLPVLLLLAGTACAGPRPASPPPAAPAPPPPPPFPHATVWTRAPATELRPDSAGVRGTVANAFTRLEVLRSDSSSLYVRCVVCTPRVEGWVETEGVVFEPRAPAQAADGELADFLLAVRDAASRRDVAALRAVMGRGFTHSFAGGDGVVEALGRWEQEGFRRLDRLPFLLDRGVATPDGTIWAAPPAWVTDRAYSDLRAGFRREGGRWEWVFLVPGPGES